MLFYYSVNHVRIEEIFEGSVLQKVCFITGGSSGIGAALVESYAADGFDVIFTGRREDCMAEVRRQVLMKFPEIHCHYFRADVCDDAQMSLAHCYVMERYGKLDVFVANAGYVAGGRFDELELEDYRRQFDVNVFGVMSGVKLFLEALKASRGSIAIIGSINSYLSLPSVSAYAMSKHAVLAFAESIRAEFKPYGISVTMICPGFIQSDIRSRNVRGEMVTSDTAFKEYFAMKSEKAARLIKNAIDQRRTEKIITWHGYFAILIRRWLPFFARYFGSFQKRKLKR